MSPTYLGPFACGDIIAGAFALYRRHFAVLSTTALITLLPIAVAHGLVGVVGFGATSPTGRLAANAGLFLAFPLVILGTLVMWAALVHEVGEAVTGRPVVRGEAYRVAFRRLAALPGAALVVMGLLLGLRLVVPGILVALVLFSILPAVVLEGKGPVEALSRSRRLARGAWGRIFGVTLVVGLIMMIMPGALDGPLGRMAEALVSLVSGEAGASFESAMWFFAVSEVLRTVVTALTTPFMTTAFTLLYFDLRARAGEPDPETAGERLPAPARPPRRRHL